MEKTAAMGLIASWRTDRPSANPLPAFGAGRGPGSWLPRTALWMWTVATEMCLSWG